MLHPSSNYAILYRDHIDWFKHKLPILVMSANKLYLPNFALFNTIDSYKRWSPTLKVVDVEVYYMHGG